MSYNWRRIKSAFDNELSDYPHTVKYTHWSDEHPVFYVTMYGMSDYDEDDSECIYDAFDRIENRFDIVRDESDGFDDITFSFIDFNN